MKRLKLGAWLILSITLAGCAGMVKKSDIARDLGLIAESADCPTACEALKNYIKDRLN